MTGKSGSHCSKRLQNNTLSGEASVAAQQSAANVAASVGAVADAAARYPGADYPKGDDGELDTQFKSIARLILSGGGTRAYYAAQDGYDTHAEQNRRPTCASWRLR